MNQSLLIDSALKGENYEKQFNPKMFSGYFRNISELRNFLYFSRNFTAGKITISLALAYKTWKSYRN